MRIALLAPLPPEKNGIADYASHFRNALQGLGIEVATPLAGVAADSANIASRLDSVDWNAFDLVSVVIPVYNEEASLPELLRRTEAACLEQAPPLRD
ncbi:hypothetical protein K3Z86_25860, partial [Pseudomonas aeruginosa]|nr:hypothetical protein [Pseudomonas aeruginosa]